MWHTNTIQGHTTLLCVVAFADLVAVSLIVPLLGTHLRSLGASHLIIGLMGSLYAALQLITSPIIGSWSDIRGHRLILLYTQIVCSVCYLLWGLTSSIALCALIRFILGAFKHTQTLCKALVAGSVPPSQHSEVYGNLNAISGLGFIIGPVIGGHLAESDNGFFYICCIVAVTFWINIGVVFWFVPETVHLSKKESDVNNSFVTEGSLMRQQLRNIFLLLQSIQWSAFWDIFALKFCLAFSVSIFHSNYVLYIQEYFGIGVKWVGYTIALQAMVGAVTSILVGRLKSLYKNDPFMNVQTFHSFIMLAASFCILGIASSWGVFVVGLITLSISSALLRVVGMEMLLQRSDVEKRGSFVGSSNSISSIARLLAPVTAGFVHSALGSKGIFVLSGMVALLGVIVACLLCYKSPQLKKSN